MIVSTHQFVINVEVDDDRLADTTLKEAPDEWTFPQLLDAVRFGAASGDIIDYTFDPS